MNYGKQQIFICNLYNWNCDSGSSGSADVHPYPCCHARWPAPSLSNDECSSNAQVRTWLRSQEHDVPQAPVPTAWIQGWTEACRSTAGQVKAEGGLFQPPVLFLVKEAWMLFVLHQTVV